MFTSRDRLKVLHHQPTPFGTFGGKFNAIEDYARNRKIADGLATQDSELFNPTIGLKHANYAASVKNRAKAKKEAKIKKFDEITGRIVQDAVYGGIVENLIATNSSNPARAQKFAEIVKEQDFREREDDLLTLAVAREVLGIDRGRLPEAAIDEIVRLGERPITDSAKHNQEVLEALQKYRRQAMIEKRGNIDVPAGAEGGSHVAPPGLRKMLEDEQRIAQTDEEVGSIMRDIAARREEIKAKLETKRRLRAGGEGKKSPEWEKANQEEKELNLQIAELKRFLPEGTKIPRKKREKKMPSLVGGSGVRR